MAACRRVYDSRHMQADCQEPGSAPGTLFVATTEPRRRRKTAVVAQLRQTDVSE